MLVIEVIDLVCGFIVCFAAKVPKQVLLCTPSTSRVDKKKKPSITIFR